MGIPNEAKTPRFVVAVAVAVVFVFAGAVAVAFAFGSAFVHAFALADANSLTVAADLIRPDPDCPSLCLVTLAAV